MWDSKINKVIDEETLKNVITMYRLELYYLKTKNNHKISLFLKIWYIYLQKVFLLVLNKLKKLEVRTVT